MVIFIFNKNYILKKRNVLYVYVCVQMEYFYNDIDLSYVCRWVISFVLMLKVHFSNYYAPLSAWTPLQLLRLDFFGSTFPHIPDHNWQFSPFTGRSTETKGKVHRYHECDPIPNLTTQGKLYPTPSSTYWFPR